MGFFKVFILAARIGKASMGGRVKKKKGKRQFQMPFFFYIGFFFFLYLIIWHKAPSAFFCSSSLLWLCYGYDIYPLTTSMYGQEKVEGRLLGMLLTLIREVA